MRLDAFIGPGHVSTVIGCRPYELIARDFGKPVVVSGFEPLDILRCPGCGWPIPRPPSAGRRTVPVLVEDGRVRQIGWQGRGCLASPPSS